MNKHALIKLIAEKAEVSHQEASKALQAFLNAVTPSASDQRQGPVSDADQQPLFTGKPLTRSESERFRQSAIRHALKYQQKK